MIDRGPRPTHRREALLDFVGQAVGNDSGNAWQWPTRADCHTHRLGLSRLVPDRNEQQATRRDLGFRPSLTFLVLGHTIVCVPFVLRTTIAALSQLDPALQDASRSLGASEWMTFRRITLPLIGKGIAAGAFLAFMASFDNVPVSLFLANERTEVLPIHLWQQIESNLDVRTAAASGVIIIVTLVLMMIAEKTAGLTRQMR